MSYRFMRVLVMFDLPVETSEDRREYSHFRKFLIRNGFVMMQESVYTKIALNNTAAEVIKDSVRKHKAKNGLIQMLVITEKQFEKTELVLGEEKNEIVNSSERLIVI